jgi:putative permease
MNRLAFWLIVLAIFCGFAYIVADTLIPFMIAFVFAYLLQPVIETNCEKLKFPRSWVTLGVFIIFLSGFITIILLIAPIIYQQMSIVVSKMPQYKSNFESVISIWSEKINNINPELANKVNESAKTLLDSAFSIFASFANHIWQYMLATINFFTIIALVPIILYYFLRDWPQIVKTIESVVPMRGKSKIREIFISINQLLSAYIRGQLNICMILAFYYTLGLNLINFDLALLLGLLSGFLIIIPFIGAMLSFLMVAISCYFTFGIGFELIYVTILYIIGHTIEGYILAPKIIGDRIGLHPLWIMFAVFAGGSVFGFIGVVFAIPLAGIVKVLLMHLIDYYKSSSMYRD